MPTNEERKAVAARLRKLVIENFGFNYSAHLGEAIGECVRLVSGHECLVEGGLNRLADLIEPEPEPERTIKPTSGGFCPDCRKLIGEGERYCAWCGAKVVE